MYIAVVWFTMFIMTLGQPSVRPASQPFSHSASHLSLLYAFLNTLCCITHVSFFLLPSRLPTYTIYILYGVTYTMYILCLLMNLEVWNSESFLTV